MKVESIWNKFEGQKINVNLKDDSNYNGAILSKSCIDGIFFSWSGMYYFAPFDSILVIDFINRYAEEKE
jgi:hypothetical protein